MMMGRDMHNARSQHLGCKVLANLSANHEVRLWIGVSTVLEVGIDFTENERNFKSCGILAKAH